MLALKWISFCAAMLVAIGFVSWIVVNWLFGRGLFEPWDAWDAWDEGTL
jgi:hypothetical protein